MTRLILRRMALLPLTLAAVFTLVFAIAHLTPGGPWQSDLPVPSAVAENLRARFHAADPIPIQYLKVFADVFFRGDLGVSYRGSMPAVSSLILDALPVSLRLGLAAMAVAIVIGMSLGAVAGLRHGQRLDHVVSGLTLIGISVPAYVSTPLLIVVFAVFFHWLPSGGWRSLFHPAAVIPIVALALGPVAHIARYTRASVSEVKGMEHVVAAEAKGLARHVLVGRHILRNGLTSVVTVIGDDFARLIAGAFFVEAVYGIPGMGRLLVDAIAGRDYPVIIGVSLTIAAMVAVTNLVVDVVYAGIDRRVRYR